MQTLAQPQANRRSRWRHMLAPDPRRTPRSWVAMLTVAAAQGTFRATTDGMTTLPV